MAVSAIPGRVLALDYGSKRVGVAMSDPLRVLAGGVGTWENDAALPGKISRLVTDEDIALIVVGMPYAPDGGKGAKAQEVEVFIGRVKSVVQVPLTTWDESYTSVDAHRVFREGGMKKKQRRVRASVDTMAARILLQQFLDAQPAPARS
jgi:putative Holliday junction resolvase